ncbi:alcohol dehydrogenase catalytic domain-containing protein [Nocardia carnea]|uniref:alcohol dehydrogenase catalytic domain-containing protein n=1 Tax=Nocardia carnea TaxID=37328 RepID=UPI0032AF5D67
MKLEHVPIPRPGDNDVLVRVHACGIVPNLANVLANWPAWFPHLPLPPLPATFGLDPAGEVVAVGSHVHEWEPGDRVYVNPVRVCGGCRACRSGHGIDCESFAFCGYFGRSRKSTKVFRNYPDGGLAEYMTAPQYALVKLPENVTYNQAARFGYLGTMYSALRKGRVGPGRTVLINGISGTLGIGGALLGIVMGANRIFGTARNEDLLKRVQALSPKRIEILSVADGESIDEWVLSRTDGLGVDVFIDALGPGAPHEAVQQAMRSLRSGGRAYNIGGVAGPVGLDLSRMMAHGQRMEGSSWFTAGEGQDIADMAEIGALDLSVFQDVAFPLEEVNDAIAGFTHRNGGFTNFVINP